MTFSHGPEMENTPLLHPPIHLFGAVAVALRLILAAYECVFIESNTMILARPEE
jgi:hypothetical protein